MPDISRQTNVPLLDVSRQVIQGHESIHKFGANEGVGTTLEDIWSFSANYPWPTAAEPVRIKTGGDVADTAAGAGARKVLIQGLDTDFNLISEELVTAGASMSLPTNAAFRRVFRAHVSESGTYTGANVNTIIIENNVSFDELAVIQPGVGQTQMTIFTIPAGKTGYLIGLDVYVDGTVRADVQLMQRQNADVVAAPFSSPRLVHQLLGIGGAASVGFEAMPEFPEKTDIWARGKATAGTARIGCTYDLILVNNDN